MSQHAMPGSRGGCTRTHLDIHVEKMPNGIGLKQFPLPKFLETDRKKAYNGRGAWKGGREGQC